MFVHLQDNLLKACSRNVLTVTDYCFKRVESSIQLPSQHVITLNLVKSTRSNDFWNLCGLVWRSIGLNLFSLIFFGLVTRVSNLNHRKTICFILKAIGERIRVEFCVKNKVLCDEYIEKTFGKCAMQKRVYEWYKRFEHYVFEKQLCSCTRESNYKSIWTFQNMILGRVVNAVWYTTNNDIHMYIGTMCRRINLKNCRKARC